MNRPMYTTVLLAGLALLAGCPAPGDSTQAQADSAEERNKEIVVAFYNAAINDKDFEKASQYLGDVYIQHNPLAADGPEGLKSFLTFAKENLSTFKIEIKRVLADGDYVMLHVHAKRDPDDRGSAVMDIFRLENGKVVEHWDVMQPIPETAMNENTMF
ncbi:MAG: nuclear transport factor 2 family protein [Gammaproteobacteria bacterium]|nr:nuclear transport factor 2 family protein [Gammaproteobacteria bacterium]MDH4253301.1 nuclear transport factor 2 family protein [Gammaproteobacteria bacterium]MDH5310541.1 nuclear transport factor 2 family protein [Gammaproteobacteria bacterium]